MSVTPERVGTAITITEWRVRVCTGSIMAIRLANTLTHASGILYWQTTDMCDMCAHAS